MATREQLQADLSWDINRLSVDIDSHASDEALDLLKEIEEGRATVQRVRRYADDEKERDNIATNDLLRTLRHADGRLALVTWSSGGITAIGYRPSEDRYDVGGYSAVQEKVGNDPEYYEVGSRAAAKDMLAWSTPDVVLRSESKLLPELDETEVTA